MLWQTVLIKDGLNTDTAKEIALKRYSILETFLEEYKAELDERA